MGATGALACLWHSDTDTLEEEGLGIPDVMNVIVGRFERNPPLYYEMRLARVAQQVETDPDNLFLYDDAGVACDKLGRGDEAITWMERKLTRIEALTAAQGETESLKTHRYRYLANVGTFWIHRWFASGADRNNLSDVESARDFIAEAIKLNPEAHFGREKYQLMALEWIIDPKIDPDDYMDAAERTFLFTPEQEHPKGHPLPSWYRRGNRISPEEVGMEDAAVAVAGLVALGNGWESFDVFNTLTLALLLEGRVWVAYLARQRCMEILQNGGKPLHQPELTHDEFLMFHDTWDMIVKEQQPFLKEYEKLYADLRANAEEWHRHRSEYMLAQLNQGRHPDSDKDFWNAYVEIAAPKLDVEYELNLFQKKYPNDGQGFKARALIYIFLGCVGILGLAIGIQVTRHGWRSLLTERVDG